MKRETGEALVLGATPFGEHDALVHLFCPTHGRLRGLVKRGRSKAFLLQPFNTIHFERYRRLEGQLGTLDVDLTVSRAPLWMGDGGGSYLCAYLADLLVRVLPEDQPFEGLVEAITDLIARVPHTPDAWPEVIAFELFVLDVLGYGLRLHDPVQTDEHDVLAYVSPRSGRSVGMQAAEGYEERLLVLPAILGGPACASPRQDCAAAFRLTGTFLHKAMPPHAPSGSLLARGRLTAYYDRAMKDNDNDILPSQAA